MSPRHLPSSPERLPPQPISLLDLPPELLQYLLSLLPLSSLLSLSLVCRSLHSTVTSHSLPALCRALGYAPTTLRHTHESEGWSSTRRACWIASVSSAWSAHDAGAELLEPWNPAGWERRCMPLLKLWNRGPTLRGRLLLARGEEVELWEVDSSGCTERVPLRPFYSKAVRGGEEDITGLSPVEGSAQEFVLGRVSGLVQRMRVEEPSWMGMREGWRAGRMVEVARYSSNYSALGAGKDKEKERWSVQSLSISSNLLATISTLRSSPTFRRRAPLSSSSPPSSIVASAADLAALPPSAQSHQLSLHSISAPWTPAITLPLKEKPWSVLLQPSPSPSWLALGSTSLTPLSLSLLHSTGDPSAPEVLCAPMESGKSSAVYSLTPPSSLSSSLHPTQTVIAAFYDSTTRLFDLRAHSAGRGAQVGVMRDPWSDDPSYSVASGGPSGAWVATGAARGGAVRVWDVRQPSCPISSPVTPSTMDDDPGEQQPRAVGGQAGATLFAPTTDRSPIYSLALESSRIWGVTDRRGFVFDFSRLSLSSTLSRGGRRREVVGARYLTHEGEGRGILQVARGWEAGGGAAAGRAKAMGGERQGQGQRAMMGGRWERGVGL